MCVCVQCACINPLHEEAYRINIVQYRGRNSVYLSPGTLAECTAVNTFSGLRRVLWNSTKPPMLLPVAVCRSNRHTTLTTFIANHYNDIHSPTLTIQVLSERPQVIFSWS